MKTAYLLGAAVLVSSLSGCNKSSDRSQGVEKQPSYPYERNPGTQPTTPQGGADGPRAEENKDLVPTEDPDSLGTTKTPAAIGNAPPSAPGPTGTTGGAPASK